MGLRDEIQSLSKPPPVTLDVPVWSRPVYVRRITAAERGRYESFVEAHQTEFGLVRAMLVALVVCDESGNREFAETDDEVNWLAEQDGSAISAIFDAALSLNGMEPDDLDAAKKD